MKNWLESPTFVVYALACVALCINLLFIWAFSGTVRARTKIAINEEDAKRFGAALEHVDPPEVARVLRVHANAQATIYPFLFLGLIFVLAGGSSTFATVVFGVFVVGRILHTVAYLAGKQPWRTLFFVISSAALVALMGDVVWLAFGRIVSR